MRRGSNTTRLEAATDGELGRLFVQAAAVEASRVAAELDAIPPQISELSQRLVRLDRRLPALARRLGELRQASPAELERRAAVELERIRRVPGVTDALVVGSALVVSTEPVVVASRALGAFRITIELGGDVRIDSQDHLGPRSEWDHPHIQGGLPCLGNLRPGLLKLIAELELGLAVQVLVDFLRSYDPETAYTPIEGWPTG